MICLGDAPVAEADPFDDAERTDSWEFDRERLNLMDSTSSELISESAELGVSGSSMAGSETSTAGADRHVKCIHCYSQEQVNALSEGGMFILAR